MSNQTRFAGNDYFSQKYETKGFLTFDFENLLDKTAIPAYTVIHK